MDKKEAAKVLNIGPEATIEEINRAFRHRSKKHHPDKPGGSQAAFLKLQLAHDVLLSKDIPKPEMSQAIAEFVSAFQKVVGKANNPLKVDLIKNTIQHLEVIRAQAESNIKSIEEDIFITKGIISRLTCTDENNFLLGMLTQHQTGSENALLEINTKITNIKNALDIARHYKYKPDVAETNLAGGMWGTASSFTFTYRS